MMSRRQARQSGARQHSKRSRAYHHGDLRVALLAAARRILEQEGLAALSLRSTARAVGVSPAAPYHHFVDKDALLARGGRARIR
jgi:AcrR family transcriptional regulator